MSPAVDGFVYYVWGLLMGWTVRAMFSSRIDKPSKPRACSHGHAESNDCPDCRH